MLQCLREACRDIVLNFDNATSDRLLAAMTKRCACLHYSGHGHPESLPFENTASLEPPKERILGQDRASDAIKFGMGMKENNYHIFIAGPSKAGLTYTARTYLEEQAKKEPNPPDLC